MFGQCERNFCQLMTMIQDQSYTSSLLVQWTLMFCMLHYSQSVYYGKYFMWACGILYITYRYGINSSMCVCACNVYIRALQLLKFEPLMLYTSIIHMYMLQFLLDLQLLYYFIMIAVALYIRTLQLSVDRWCMYTMHVLEGDLDIKTFVE